MFAQNGAEQTAQQQNTAQTGTENAERIQAAAQDEQAATQPSPAQQTPVEQAAPPKTKTTTVTIVYARTTEYGKDPHTGGDAIMLSGGVELSVDSDGSVTVVKADEVRYNRETRMIYARGSVTLEERKQDGSTENLTAEVLLLNTETLEGVFDNARIVSLENIKPSASGSSGVAAGPTGSNPSIIVSSEIMGKSAQNTIAFKNGSLTFCDEEDNPHWKINASRIWLLPGNEFAFFNALLYVGNIPVFYLPFFYYPKDELVFNPVVGYEGRRGFFTQTTTYIIGRKPIETDTSGDAMISFLKQSEYKEQRLEGLILRNLDEDLKVIPRDYLKLVADYYSNLGWLMGIDGKFAPNTAVPQLDFSFFTGFSRTVFRTLENANVYTIYGTQTGKVFQDESNFLGTQMPFRYKANVNVRITQPFALSLAMPLYSDVYFESDFLKTRSETMDWLNYLISSEATKFDSETAQTEVASFSWNLDSSYNVPVAPLNPYLSSLSLTFGSSLLFSNKENQQIMQNQEIRSVSPARKFYYPAQSTPARAVVSFAGTIFQYPWTQSQPKREKHIDDEARNAARELQAPEGIKPAAGAEAEDSAAKSETPVLDISALPTMLPAVTPENMPGGFTYKLGYSVSTDVTNQLSFVPPTLPEDFDWNKVLSSMVTLRSPVTLTSNTAWRDNFIGMTNTLSFSPIYQSHPILRESGTAANTTEGYSPSYIQSIQNSDYGAQKLDTTLANAVTLKPFVYNKIFADSNISWNTNLNVIRTEYIGTFDKPEWEYHKPKWDDTSITAHTLNVTLTAREGKFSQSVTLTSNLPPRIDYYGYSTTLGFPYVTLTVQNGVGQRSKIDETWKFDPLRETLSVKLFSDKLTLSQSYTYDIEEKVSTALQTSAAGYGLSFAYNMQYTYGYDMTPQNTYKTRLEREFLPVSLSLLYNMPSNKIALWKNRIAFTPSLSTNIVYDLLRPTQSYFTFVPKITFSVHQFLDISFSATSRNNVIYRYFQHLDDLSIVVPGETDMFKDLLNSFAFGDDRLRQESGFKLQSLTLSVKHELHDWLLTSSLTIEPRLIRDKPPYYYDMSPFFTISVLWRPMQSIKTTIEDRYGKVTLNP
jgi:lipopolysaccharide assembly outer membrane protein LptD (OstA)